MMGDRGLRDVSAVRAIFSISIPSTSTEYLYGVGRGGIGPATIASSGEGDEAHISYFLWRNQTETWTR
jgi:hypothetical protein